jgi:glucose-6-phosphate isomerase
MKFEYQKNSLVSEEELQPLAEQLEPYRQQLGRIAETVDYAQPESSIQLPFDSELLGHIRQLADTLRTPTLQYVVVIGIGGSNLGAMSVYEAVAGSMNLLIDRLPKLLFLDTVSDERMTSVTRQLINTSAKEDFAVVAISKSGGTTEVIANTEALWRNLKDHFGNVSNRFAVVTSKESKLWQASINRGIHRISLPDAVGGRYSVFSAAGLLPIALANIDIKELLEGAREAVKDGVDKDFSKNHSLVSALLTYLHFQKGRVMHNTFLFSPKLENLGKWYRQLMGESIGKEQDVDGKTVHAGITPIVSIGSTDLHSMAQLYYGGPDDKFTNLVYSLEGDVNRIPNHLELPGLVEHIQGKSLENIMSAIIDGVKTAYEQKKRPYIAIELKGVNPRELGYYQQFRMIEMMYLAKLMNLNAFNQPAVETYKTATRNFLKSI